MVVVLAVRAGYTYRVHVVKNGPVFFVPTPYMLFRALASGSVVTRDPKNKPIRTTTKGDFSKAHPLMHRNHRTHPGPTVEARLLLTKNSVSADKGGVGKISSMAVRNRVIWC